LLRSLLVSAFCFVLNMGTLITLVESFAVDEELAFATSQIVIFFTSFVLLRYYVYDSRRSGIGGQFAAYAVSALTFRGCEYLAFLVLHTWLGGEYRLCAVGILATSTLVKFLYYRWLFERGTSTVPSL
jgi:putative flippase GtrA